MTSVDFVHLHVHSSYSLLESANKVADLIKLAAEDGQPAMALTDSNNMFGALEFSEKASGSGIQPIPGIHVSLAFDAYNPGLKDPRPATFDIVLLAKNEAGYINLMALASQAYFGVPLGDDPMVAVADLAAHSDGLICLTGGLTGPLSKPLRGDKRDVAEAHLDALLAIYGTSNLYVEIQRQGFPGQDVAEKAMIEMADARGVSIVATNEPFFPKAEDYEAHDALLALSAGTIVASDNRRRINSRFSFKTRAQMQKLFEDLPDALAATVEIAQRCSYRVRTRKPILPSFGEGNEAEDLKRQAEEGLEFRLEKHGPADGFTAQQYRDRLAYEVEVITKMGFPGYFLIVSDFIKWAKDNGIPVGPGRGSGAGSVVAWSLLITDLDPLRWGLLFERFLNPERVSMPDFDVDFCVDGRQRVIEYVQDRYGHGNVAQIITFGTLLARGVLNDVGRVLELPYGLVNRLSQMVPNNPAKPVKLAEAIKIEPKLQEAIDTEPGVDKLMEISKRLEGLHRHASTHAAGVVIGDRPLEQLVPMYRDPKTGMRVTQFNMKWVEPAGLVKFDFLGLKTLTVIRRAIDLVAKRGIEIDISTIPLDDKRTFEMMRRAEVLGVFQVESAGMRKALVEMEADRLEDIIALVALYRPGPMANIPLYCDRKLGRDDDNKAEWYPHPKLESVLSETFGIIVYQEQVMEVAKVLAGYSLGDADLLRRAMGKKIKAEMDAQRDRFVRGSVERGLDYDHAQEIFDLLAKFADYGFNKSHAAAYALITYQTAFLKAHYPTEFLAASMTMEMDNTDKLSEFRQDAKDLGILVEPPSLNRSGATFEVNDGVIRYALAAIKGVGITAAEEVAVMRGDKPFADLGDLAHRISPRLLNKRVMERLVSAGALDSIEPDRARAAAAVAGMVEFAQRRVKKGTATNDLFSVEQAPVILQIPAFMPWTGPMRLQNEYDALGSFLTGHPLDEYGDVLADMGFWTWAGLKAAVHAGADNGRMAAVVINREEKRTKTGKKLGIVTLSDQSGQYEAILFSDQLDKFRSILEPGMAITANVSANLDGEDVKVRIRSCKPLDGAVADGLKGLRVTVDPAEMDGLQIIKATWGSVPVTVKVDGFEAETKLPGLYGVTPAMLSLLKNTPGIRSVAIA
ncbi:DNA polymerase III subunit alpha [Methylobacterium sp. WL120]|uniref:DNA polymerase III subunit alpha n=1 Tax=Methylobacterium sp. WL120 TaxID=2603887 RepID=UPI0011C7DF88|nr:DNA polymerase III subunit alpha [Methylobacterium sp. WL120]TXM68313.1 DNA polymerase III subunit alpha [Methylobacterium sp. WL120]